MVTQVTVLSHHAYIIIPVLNRSNERKDPGGLLQRAVGYLISSR